MNLMSFKKYHNVPFKEIPEENRVKSKELAICQGGCNSIKRIEPSATDSQLGTSQE